MIESQNRFESMSGTRVPIPQELRAVSSNTLEEYVFNRLRQFSQIFASLANPQATPGFLESCFNQAYSQTSSSNVNSIDHCILRFRHHCKFLGCLRKECVMCKNNPNKRCRDEDNFDECYADCQVLRSKCEADIFLELVDPMTGQAQSVPGIELQVSVVDGESWSETTPTVFTNVRELLKSDEGQPLLSSLMQGTRSDIQGRLFLRLQDGYARLPDVTVTDKNDTFHLAGQSFSTFRLMARAMKRDLYGNASPVDTIPVAISGKFVVKTQRALNDYRKSEYPHYKDELTKLKYIGSITAQRLRDIQAHIGMEVPFTSIETVEQLRHLMQYADQNRQVENKLLELLNMKGKHKHKWDYLREILFEKIVYDDVNHRAWYTDDSMSQGLLFAAKQAQINMDKPVGIMRRVAQGGQPCLQVFTGQDGATTDTMRAWKALAEQAWVVQGHPGWTLVQERMEILNNGGLSMVIPGTQPPLHHTLSSAMSAPMSPQDALDEAGPASSYHRHSSGLASPHSRRSDTPSNMRQASSVGAPPQTQLQPQQLMGTPQGGPLDFHFRAAGLSTGSVMQRPGVGVGVPACDATFRPTMDPAFAAGMFQFTAAPPGMQGVAGQGAGEMLPDSYRTSSVPHGMATEMQQQQQETGVRSRSGRLRRNSAPSDALGLAAHLPQLIPTQAQAQFPHHPAFDPDEMEMSFNKRPRASAPSGLIAMADTQMVSPDFLPLAQGHPDRAALDRARLNFYHQESSGRHLPRTRTSQDSLALSSPMFDRAEAELERLLEGMGGDGGMAGGSFNVKEERISPPPDALVGMGLAGPAVAGMAGYLSSAGGSVGGVSSTSGLRRQDSSTQRLSATMQTALHLGHQELQQPRGSNIAAAAAAAVAAHDNAHTHLAEHPMFHDFDSFNKSGNRMFQHSESDSFRRLLMPLASPMGRLNSDSGFDKALDDLMQQGHFNM